jgi:hypothetical protein
VIKNYRKVEEFEREQAEKEPLSYRQALAVYEALFEEAVNLGAINPENIMDGFEVDIRIAKALNSLK